MYLADFFEKNKPLLRHALQDFLKRKIDKESETPFLKDALSRLVKFSTDGKMIRGNLVLLAIPSFNKTIDDLVSIASAVELMHSGFLIHDDIIDDDSLRREHRTIFAQYKEMAEKSKINKSKFYGQSMGICVGDLAFFLAFELLSSMSFDPQKITKIIQTFSREIQRVGAAEMADFHYGASLDEPSIDEIINIYRYKSARYTFSLPFRIGAIVADIDENIAVKLESFGEKLGIVFQIKDDELGLFGDEKDIGKPVGSDIKQNKKTLFRALLLQKANPEDRKVIDQVFGKQNINSLDVKKIKELITKYHVKDMTDKMVNDFSSEANKILEELRIPNDFRTILKELIEYNTFRSK